MQYNWQQKDWPIFSYDLTDIEPLLLQYLEKTAHLSGILRALPEGQKEEAAIELMTVEALKNSEIEGEIISREDVKSSIRNHLGLSSKTEPVNDLRAIGLGQLMAMLREGFAEQLTAARLFGWHQALLSYRRDLNSVGQWRQHSEPMQVVSGAMGKEKIHFEAPPSELVPDMMERFLSWFNNWTPLDLKTSPVRAAIAHLYFESIHPFEDGNGRIGRAVAEKALSQGLGAPVPFSLSKAIESDKKAYYKALEQAQKSNEISDWMAYFVPLTLRALDEATVEILFTIQKAHFFERFQLMLNERQLKIIRRMFDAGPKGFEGGMNARKYGGITGASKATATRDLQQLVQMGALMAVGGGRSVRYEIVL